MNPAVSAPTGYICCGCGLRYTADSSAYTYKTSCICRECFDKLEQTPEPMHFLSAAHENLVYAPFYYTREFRELFAVFKFRGNEACGHMIGMASAERLGKVDELHSYDFITPVPLSKQRLMSRGYNQSEIMARYLSEVTAVPIGHFLEKIRDTKPQSSIHDRDKLTNVEGAFRACGDAEGKRIIIFDDIHTSGSTLNECEKMLKNAGAKEVCLAASAYVSVKFK